MEIEMKYVDAGENNFPLNLANTVYFGKVVNTDQDGDDCWQICFLTVFNTRLFWTFSTKEKRDAAYDRLKVVYVYGL
jgi:hypothetical protein